MSEVTQLFFALGVLIAVAKTCGYIATRFGQPAVLGERIAGVFMGPSVINLLHVGAWFRNGISIEHTVIEFAEIGVVFLMFSAGLEVDLASLTKVGRSFWGCGHFLSAYAGNVGEAVPSSSCSP